MVSQMTDSEIIRHIDDGANFYLGFLGDASHMEYCDNGYYSFIKPKEGEQGVRFAFNVRIEDLSEKEQTKKIEEIKALDMPVWWDLQSSERLYKLIHGEDKKVVAGAPADGEELYMAVFPDQLIAKAALPVNTAIKKADNPKDFELWANVVNNILNGGYPAIHDKNHYHLCRKGKISCFSCCKDNTVVSVASIMNNNNISSLEFVATVPEHRRKGLAKAICFEAIRDAFLSGSKIITVRAINPGTRDLYKSLGFKIFNYAL